MDAELYATPRRDVRFEDCYFYHSMELPSVGVVDGNWDLREVVDQYLGGFDFRGKRVLDVGAASGYLTFEMEARGAEVVSFDMVDGSHWNMVPNADWQDQHEKKLQNCVQVHDMLKNAYWYAHQEKGSQARVHYGDVYNLPVELGEFDVVFFGMILGHLRDPFQALWSASRLCSGSVIVTNQWPHKTKKSKKGKKQDVQALAYFMPSRENGEDLCWWALSDVCIQRMLELLGFDCVTQTESLPQCRVEGRTQKESCVSTIVERKRGTAVSPKPAPQRRAG